MKQILKRLKKHWPALLLTVLSIVGSAAASLMMPAYLAGIIDKHIPTGDTTAICTAGGFMLLFTLIGGLCLLVNGYLAARIAAAPGKELRDQVFSHVTFFLRPKSTTLPYPA